MHIKAGANIAINQAVVRSEVQFLGKKAPYRIQRGFYHLFLYMCGFKHVFMSMFINVPNKREEMTQEFKSMSVYLLLGYL